MKDLSLSIHMIGKVQSRDITLGPWFQNQSLEHHLVQDYMRTGHQDLAVPCLNHPQNTAPPQGPLRTWQPFKNVMFAVLRPTHSYFYNTSYPPKSSKLVPIKELYIYIFFNCFFGRHRDGMCMSQIGLWISSATATPMTEFGFKEGYTWEQVVRQCWALMGSIVNYE